MRRLLTVLSLTAALAFAACGDDEEEPATTSGATGATGADGAAVAGDIATAGDYLDASLPDEVKALEGVAAGEPACEGVDFEKENFQVGVAISAAQADPETPFAELVASECEEE